MAADILNHSVSALRGNRQREHYTEKSRHALEAPAIAADAEELAARQKKLNAALEKVESLFARWSELHK